MDLQGDQIEGECGVTRSIFDELHSWDIRGDEMEGESGLTRRTIDELQSCHIEGGQMEGEGLVLLQVSLMNFILGISKEIKWKVKVVLREVS